MIRHNGRDLEGEGHAILSGIIYIFAQIMRKAMMIITKDK
jgi:hypothetical protein